MTEAAIEMDTQYLTFTLREELFAVNIGKVREVIEFTTANSIPGMPTYMRGVINLRGAVVPVMDLRQKFGMGSSEKTVDTCVIITEVMMGETMIVLGALADAVQEVFDLLPDQIEPPPSIGTSIDTSFIKGMGKKGDDFVILLDIDKVFTSEEMAALAGEEANKEAE
jgi:purine-binding chemotaxis protein CheW